MGIDEFIEILQASNQDTGIIMVNGDIELVNEHNLEINRGTKDVVKNNN